MAETPDVLGVVSPTPEEPGAMVLQADNRCLSCYTNLADSSLYEKNRVCHNCGFHYTIPARKRVDLLADAKSFREFGRSITPADPISFSVREPYKKSISEDQRRTGLREAAITGTCRIKKTRVVIAALDFGFLGGSMGSVVGEKIALAFERAVKRKIPMVALINSGGARMQEGLLSLMQMAKTVAAAQRLHENGLPFIAVLGNPSTGPVYSSFANLADIIIAEPGALLGNTPLRDVENASDGALPEGSQTALSHLKRGLVDMIVPRIDLRDTIGDSLKILLSHRGPSRKRGRRTPKPRKSGVSAWQSVQLTRMQERPKASYYVDRMISSFVELHGDRIYGDDPSIVSGIGYLSGGPVAVIGQEWDRAHEEEDRRRGLTLPEGFRKAQRVMHLASKFHLPVITLIDTPGPSRSIGAEERGMGNAIASTISLMSTLPTPIVSAIIGEGGSEAALALGVAYRVLMMENAIYATISPEDAAALLYRDAGRAQEVAGSLKLTAQDCKRLNIVDVLVPEPEGGAHMKPDEAADILERQLIKELRALRKAKIPKLLQNRYKKFRRMGEYSSYLRDIIAREVALVQDALARGVRGLRSKLPSRRSPSQPQG